MQLTSTTSDLIQCHNCQNKVSANFRYCPFCAISLTPENSVLAMDHFIRDRIEQQVHERMKDDRLVASEVTDKVIRNLKFTFFPVVLCFGLLAWFGYTNVKQAIEPLSKEAVKQANAALATARQARVAAQGASKLAEETNTQAVSASKQTLRRVTESTQLATQVESKVTSAAKSADQRLLALAQSADSFGQRLKSSSDTLTKYEQRLSSVGNQVTHLTVNQRFPELGQPLGASVGNEAVSANEKKPGEKFLVFDYTPWARREDMLTGPQVEQFVQNVQAAGFRVFIGTPSYGRGALAFEVIPFHKGKFRKGVLVQYFNSTSREAATSVFRFLSKYTRISTKEPEYISADNVENKHAADFLRSSGTDVYVEIYPPERQ